MRSTSTLLETRGVATACVFMLVLALVSAVRAATWVVDPSGFGDFVEIQPAVNAAAPGDTVLVKSGTYSEWVKIFGKNGLYLLGDGPVESVIIENDTAAVDIRDTTLPVHVQSVTISGSSLYGGLFTMGARVEVVGCVFRDNVGPGSCHGVGGGIRAQLQSDLVIEDCVIENNTGWESPGGVIIWESRADIRRNVFRGNSACYGGALEMYHCQSQSTSYIEDNLFVANSVTTFGGAIFNVDSSPVFRRNTFYANEAADNAAIWVLGGSPTITQNVIVKSTYGVYCQMHPQYPPSTPIMGCNVFWDLGQSECFGCPNAGEIIAADPLFCGATSGDFSVCEDSPAMSASCGPAGAFGVGCPSCGVPTQATTWGRVKSLFQ